MNIAQDSANSTRETQGSSNQTFGLVFTALLFAVGMWPLVHGIQPKLWALVISGVLLLFSLFWPAGLTLPNRIWTRFGMLLHSITSPVALGILFYGMFVPLGLTMRALGKDPLRLKFEQNVKTYWIQRKPPGPSPDSLIDQF